MHLCMSVSGCIFIFFNCCLDCPSFPANAIYNSLSMLPFRTVQHEKTIYVFYRQCVLNVEFVVI